jgi:hypothetical protein
MSTEALTLPSAGEFDLNTYADERRMVEEQLVGSDAWRKLDQIDAELEAHPDSFRELPTNHVFTPGLYVRQVFMKKGDLLTTRVHLSEHPFIISAGVVSMWDAENGVQTVQAHYTGITTPGTRRILYIHEDTIWSTCHPNPTNETDPEKIIAAITYDHRKLRIYEGAPT